MADSGIFTYAGISAFKDIIYDEDNDHFLYVACGDGMTAATASDTELEFEIIRVPAVISTPANGKIRFSAGLGPLDGEKIQEYAIFNDDTAGTMLWKHVEDDWISTDTDDYISFILEITLTASGNRLTTAGLNELRNLMGDLSTPNGFGYIAYGTGTAAESASLTALGAEVDREECAETEKGVWSVLGPNDTLRLFKVFTSTETSTVTEVGIFNASLGGDMLARTLLASPLSIVPGDKFIVVYDVTVYN